MKNAKEVEQEKIFLGIYELELGRQLEPVVIFKYSVAC